MDKLVKEFRVCLETGHIEAKDLAAELYKLLIESQDYIGGAWRERRDTCLARIAEILK